MTGSVSLEEKIALLAKSMELPVANVKKKDKQITFMMNKITSLIEKRANYFGAESKSKSARRKGKFY